MKVLILGDVHIGAGLGFGKPDQVTGVNSRLTDYEKTLSSIITYAINKKIELFVMVGDIFETRNPPPGQMVIFYKQLKRLSDAGVTTYVMMGNHDYIKTRVITSSLDPLKEIHLPHVTVFTDIKLMQFKDSMGERLNVILMPYRNRQSYDKASNEDAVREMQMELFLEKQKMTPNIPSLLCGHMMMEGTIPSDAGEYGINELILPFEMFEGIDVVVNGHIHRASILQQNPLFIYSGSMECKDFSEKEHQKVFLVYDSLKTGIDAFSFKAIPTRKFVDFEIDYSTETPENPMESILEKITISDINDAVVRLSVRAPETKTNTMDQGTIRDKLYSAGANLVSSVSITPVISKQLRNQRVTEAPDDITAFRHYVTSQLGVEDGVLDLGLTIISADIE